MQRAVEVVDVEGPLPAELVTAQPKATILSGATDIGLWITKQAFDPDVVIYTGRVRELRQMIEATGPISVAEFMKQSLLHPSAGFYTSGDVFGRAGDFTTAPEISQLFGELIALWLVLVGLAMQFAGLGVIGVLIRRVR